MLQVKYLLAKWEVSVNNFVLSKIIHISELEDTTDQNKYFLLFAWYYVRSEQLIFNLYHVIRLEVMALCKILMSRKEMNSKSWKK